MMIKLSGITTTPRPPSPGSASRSSWPTKPPGRACSSTARYHEAKELGVDESVMWGEYFFVETLARVVKPT